jgi:hypothetical protein
VLPSGTFSNAVDDETALLSRLRAGDERAFEALVAQHEAALRRVARSYLRTDSAVDVFVVGIAGLFVALLALECAMVARERAGGPPARVATRVVAS